MPNYPVPPPVFGPPEFSEPSGDSTEDWFNRWIAPLMR
jgi:hypothetical protein